MVFHVFTCHGGSFVYMSSCFYMSCHGGSCVLHVMVVLEFSMFWWFMFFCMSWWFMLFLHVMVVKGLGGWVGDWVGVSRVGMRISCFSHFFGRDGKDIVGGKVLLQVPPRKDNSLSAVSCGINVWA